MDTKGFTIIVADDHDMVRSGFCKILSEAFPTAIIREASTHAQALALVKKENTPLLLILDLNMPEGTGQQTIQKLKSDNQDVKILVVSMYEEEQFGIRMIKAGADGYISKSSSAKELVRAVRKIMLGKKYISGSLADLLAETVTQTGKPATIKDILSEREFEVFRQIALGKTVSEIAALLNLSVKTISTYRSKIIEKTGLKNNSEMMLYALQNKIV
ncbi:MAG: response regulator [Bacteroidales bacterium]